jgi:Zn finger protein HypA/HybF involved in hydrogenase expression
MYVVHRYNSYQQHTLLTVSKGKQMIQTINNSEFHNAFNRMDRGSQFSYEALNLIYEYLESVEEDTGEPIELDVICICCEYSESDYEEIASSYSIDLDGIETEEEKIEAVRHHLEDNTTLVGEPSYGYFVYEQF